MVESPTGHWVISHLQPIKPLLLGIPGLDDWVTLVLVILLTFCIYRNLRKYDSVTQAMDTLFRRYLRFRSDKQITLKIHEHDEEVRNEILKSISQSWKHFRTTHGKLLDTLLGDIRKTLLAYYVILGILLINTLRVFLADCFKTGEVPGSLEFAIKEAPCYLLLVLGFLLIRVQTRHKRGGGGRPYEVELETIFADIGLQDRNLYDEFEPMDEGEGREEADLEKPGKPEGVIDFEEEGR
jgi:hypothetical protein